MSKMDKLKEIIRELIKKELDEADLENKKKKAEKDAEIAKEAAEKRLEDQLTVLEALTDASIALADKRIAKRSRVDDSKTYRNI